MDYLRKYERTLDEDKEALKGSKLAPFSNERHAVIMLKGEKEILHHYVLMADTCIPLLEMDAMQAALSQIDRKRGLPTEIGDYIRQVIYPLIHASSSSFI